MAKISSKKALKVAKRNKRYNLKFKEAIKKAIKSKEAASLLDKAALKGVIHKNKARRLKSRITKNQPKTRKQKK